MEPIIFSEENLAQARAWLAECNGRWSEPADLVQIGDAKLVSPLDGSSNKVALYLKRGLLSGNGGVPVNGKTIIGILSEDGTCLAEATGRTILLNSRMPPQNIRFTLLHEITHAVDPDFPADLERQRELHEQAQAEERRVFNEELYALPSEQRAFVSMWTEDLREDMAQGLPVTPGVAIQRYRGRSLEFNAFANYCQLGHPAEQEQTMDHLRRIVAQLRRRADNQA